MRTTTSPPPVQLEDCEESTWDAFVQHHPAAHLLQLSGWGALKQRFGWDAERVAMASTVEPGALPQICAGALLLFRRAAGLTLGYAPRGPLVDWHDRSQTTVVLDSLEHACRMRGAAVLKIEPDLPDTWANRALLASYGFRPSSQTIQPPSTTVLDIFGSEDEVLLRMKSKWRYNVRLAQRKGVSVRECTSADLPVFNALMAATAERDGFGVHDPEYYAAAHRLLAPDHAVFLLAEFAGEPLAAIVVGCVGQTAWYLWGASGDRERNRMPNHALQWAGMNWARARGATRYDFWGIPDELGRLAMALNHGDGSAVPVDALPLEIERFPSHGLWGVYRFKQGFGGVVVRTVGAWDRPVSALGYAAYRAGLRALKVKQEIGDWRLETGDTCLVSNLQSPIEWRKPSPPGR